MNHFSIRDIENLCGIRAHTLRIWEQRYRLCIAKRKDSRHRVYDNEDLKELLRVSYLYHQGYKISRIADMTSGEINEAIISVDARSDTHAFFIHQMLEASIDFDKERFDQVTDNVVNHLGIEKAVFSVFYPFLNRIGVLWMTNHVIPAQEHFCSHIIRKKIICAIDKLELVRGDAVKVLLFAPEGELHEIPLLAADYLLKKNKLRTVYFGINTALDTLTTYLQHQQVDYIYTHLISCPSECVPDRFLLQLREKFPGNTFVLSGPAIRHMQQPIPGITLINEPGELVPFILKKNLNAGGD